MQEKLKKLKFIKDEIKKLEEVEEQLKQEILAVATDKAYIIDEDTYATITLKKTYKYDKAKMVEWWGIDDVLNWSEISNTKINEFIKDANQKNIDALYSMRDTVSESKVLTFRKKPKQFDFNEEILKLNQE